MNLGFEKLFCMSMGDWNFDWQVETGDRTTSESLGARGVIKGYKGYKGYKDYKDKVGHEPHAPVRIETKRTYGERGN